MRRREKRERRKRGGGQKEKEDEERRRGEGGKGEGRWKKKEGCTNGNDRHNSLSSLYQVELKHGGSRETTDFR